MPDRDPTAAELIRLVRETRDECARVSNGHVGREVYDAHREADRAEVTVVDQRLTANLALMETGIETLGARIDAAEERARKLRIVAWTSVAAPTLVGLIVALIMVNLGGAT